MTVAKYVQELCRLGEAQCEPGLTDDQIDAYENRRGIRLPASFRDLFRFADGVELKWIEIDPTTRHDYYPNERVLTFHAWGNGDFTGLHFANDEAEPNVVFVNHGPAAIAVIAPTFETWFYAVMDEYHKFGELAHPIDLVHAPREAVCLPVLDALSEVDCEFRNNWLQ